MGSPIVDLLLAQVKDKGWLAVGNIMFEDGVPCVNPITCGGTVCISESLQIIFTTGRHDSHNTFVVENGFVAQDDRMAGLQQTIVCNPFDRLRQFDVLTFSQWFRTDKDGRNGDKFLVPSYPKVAEVEKMVMDEETGLYDGSDTVTTIGGVSESAINVYPDYPHIHKEYAGIRVKEYQEFIKRQKMFCKLINTMFGTADCI